MILNQFPHDCISLYVAGLPLYLKIKLYLNYTSHDSLIYNLERQGQGQVTNQPERQKRDRKES